MGSRKVLVVRAVKIPASYDAWRLTKRRKHDSKKFDFLGSQKSVFGYFSWILEELDNFRHQNQLPCEILFQVYRFSAPSDPQSSFLGGVEAGGGYCTIAQGSIR